MAGTGLENEYLSLLCDPDTRYGFERDGSTLRNLATGRVYPIRDEIPLFISSLNGSNLHAQILYDRIGSVYDLASRFYGPLRRARELRREFLAPLRLAPGARVLEVGIGTGANLAALPASIDLYGVDVSWRMLKVCRKRLRKLNREAHLFHAEGSRLPFRAAVFDAVIHTLGLRRFTAPERAVREMIWVARPGAQVVVVDVLPPGAGDSLARWIPADVDELEVQTLGDGAFERVSFRVPEQANAAHKG